MAGLCMRCSSSAVRLWVWPGFTLICQPCIDEVMAPDADPKERPA